MHCLALWSKNCEHICHGAHWGKRRLVGMVDLTLCARLSKEVSKWLRRSVHSLWSALNISMGASILPVQYSWANVITLFPRGNRRYSLASSLFVRGKARVSLWNQLVYCYNLCCKAYRTTYGKFPFQESLTLMQMLNSLEATYSPQQLSIDEKPKAEREISCFSNTIIPLGETLSSRTECSQYCCKDESWWILREQEMTWRGI